MGVHDQTRTGQIDVIEWTEDASGIMLWRFPAGKQEIMYGAKLHVHESQVALFMFNGQPADIFKPGIYTLTWENMPGLQIFHCVSADVKEKFSANIYFIKTKFFLDENWVFEKPVALRDPTYGMIRVNAFGTFDIRVANPARLISKSGTQESFSTAEAGYRIGNMMQNLLPNGLKQSNISLLEEDNDYSGLAPFIQESINTELYASGLMIDNLRIHTSALKPEN